jgi:hypothetical protein
MVYLLLLQTLRETCNTAKYEQIMDKIAGRLGPAYTADRCVAHRCTRCIHSHGIDPSLSGQQVHPLGAEPCSTLPGLLFGRGAATTVAALPAPLQQRCVRTYPTAQHSDACLLDVVVCRSLVDAVDSSASQRQERLESELHGHKTNLIKESIRQSHNLLGDFYYNRGDLQVGTSTRTCL